MVCAQFRPPGGDQLTFSGTQPMTVHGVEAEAKLAGRKAIGPWDSLPNDHFVAQCTYTGGDVGSFSTIGCPNGPPVAVPAATEYFVDEEGRSSVGPEHRDGASVVRRLPACLITVIVDRARRNVPIRVGSPKRRRWAIIGA